MSTSVPMTERRVFGRVADSLLFPMRAIILPENSRFGLSSLRDERMRLVARYCSGLTLDIGCGPGNVFATYFRAGAVGIDVFAYPGVTNVVPDMSRLPFDDGSFDTVTLIAVGGHIPQGKRKAQFLEIARILKTGGRLLVTEGEPITQTVSHVFRHITGRLTGKKGMDDLRGMEEEEQYCMPYRELMTYLNTAPMKLSERCRFMWGLNNLYVVTKV